MSDTGPNEDGLVPMRLIAATHAGVLTGEDVRHLVRRDVRLILTRWTDLRAALLSAYRAASSDAKTLLEGMVAETDPRFLQTPWAGHENYWFRLTKMIFNQVMPYALSAFG